MIAFNEITLLTASSAEREPRVVADGALALSFSSFSFLLGRHRCLVCRLRDEREIKKRRQCRQRAHRFDPSSCCRADSFCARLFLSFLMIVP